MTNKELKELLDKYPDDKEVLFRNFSRGEFEGESLSSIYDVSLANINEKGKISVKENDKNFDLEKSFIVLE